MKKLISLVLVAASLLLAGCASPQIQNAAVGTVLGGAVGALLGDSGKAARIGAGLGLLAGSVMPVHGQGYGQPGYGQPYPYPGATYPGNFPPPPPGISCRPDSRWDGRGCRYMGNSAPMYPHGYPNGYPNGYPQPQPAYPAGTNGPVYQADPRTCPRVQLGGGRWRCQ